MESDSGELHRVTSNNRYAHAIHRVTADGCSMLKAGHYKLADSVVSAFRRTLSATRVRGPANLKPDITNSRTSEVVTSIFVAGFEPTLYSSYTVPTVSCWACIAVFFGASKWPAPRQPDGNRLLRAYRHPDTRRHRVLAGHANDEPLSKQTSRLVHHPRIRRWDGRTSDKLCADDACNDRPCGIGPIS